jgi:5-methylcytosine-specific restriction endonuclease McrA
MKLRQLEPSQRYRKSKNKNFRVSLWQRTHGRCWYCGVKIKYKDLILEHQEPFSKGGADSKRNLVPACAPCDKLKGARSLEEFRDFIQAKAGTKQAVRFHGEAAKGERFWFWTGSFALGG